MNYFSRRNLIKIGAGAVSGALVTSAFGHNITRADQGPVDSNITPDEALKELLDGNKRFVDNKRQSPHQTFERLTEISKQQKPFASILGCADSRVPSEIIFDQGFGDLFVCRVAGNVVTAEETGSLEYGALVLGTKVLMVMGHKSCGAVDATIKGAQVPGQIGSLLAAIKPAVESTKNLPGDQLENATKANVLLQIENLKKSPILSELIAQGKFKIVGAFYDLENGKVTVLS